MQTISNFLQHAVFTEWDSSMLFRERDDEKYTFSMSVSYTELTKEREYISQARYIISSKHKEEVINSAMSIVVREKENEVLERALRSVWKMSKLSGNYASLMEKFVSDDDYNIAMRDYEDIAKLYAYKPRKLKPYEIAFEAKTVLDAVSEELGSDEIAEILELDVMDVEKALSEYSYKDTETFG